MKKIVIILALVGVMFSCVPKKDANQLLTDRAAAEYLTPVHPGGGDTPFGMDSRKSLSMRHLLTLRL